MRLISLFTAGASPNYCAHNQHDHRNGDFNRYLGMGNSITCWSAGCCHALQCWPAVVHVHNGTSIVCAQVFSYAPIPASSLCYLLPCISLASLLIDLAVPSLASHPHLADLAMLPPNLAMPMIALGVHIVE